MTGCMTCDLIAEAIANSVSGELETRKHTYKLSSFEKQLPTNTQERETLLQQVVKQISRLLHNCDVFIDGDTIRVNEL